MFTKREVHTRGLVLSRRQAGEGSLRIMLFTEELGLVTALATSAREERSKLRAHLVPGTRGTYSLVRGRDQWRVTGAVRTVNEYFAVQQEEVQKSFARVISFVRQFVRGEGKNDELFGRLWEYCGALHDVSAKDIRTLEYLVVLRTLAALGYVAPSDDEHDFIASPLTAALLMRAGARTGALVRHIHRGMSASGL